MKTIFRSRAFIAILCLFFVFSLTVTNTVAETKRNAEGFAPLEIVSLTAFAVVAGVGAGIGAIRYGLELVFTGDDFSGSRLAAQMTVGAATWIASLAMCFSGHTLNAILGLSLIHI